jgi:adenylate cyclase
MGILDDLTQAVDEIARSRWEITDGRVVPETEDIGLGNKGVRLDAAMLYADLADSTELASNSQTKGAEIYKAFLICGTKIILHRGGYIRSFDGDRVMGVFIGTSKNTSAVKAAMNIKYVFNEILVPRFKQQYDVFKDGTLNLNYCAGVDTGSVLVARAGVRNNNDLVWVGQAPNVAAKLSTIRDAPYNTYITKAIYDNMNDEAKFTNGQNMWEARNWTALPVGFQSCYRSSWHWKP